MYKEDRCEDTCNVLFQKMLSFECIFLNYFANKSGRVPISQMLLANHSWLAYRMETKPGRVQ